MYMLHLNQMVVAGVTISGISYIATKTKMAVGVYTSKNPHCNSRNSSKSGDVWIGVENFLTSVKQNFTWIQMQHPCSQDPLPRTNPWHQSPFKTWACNGAIWLVLTPEFEWQWENQLSLKTHCGIPVTIYKKDCAN
jgi:hypothetical protein